MSKALALRALAISSVGLLALSGNASASDTCTSSFYSQYQSCRSGGTCSPYSTPEEFVAAHPGCFPGGGNASAVQVSSTTFVQVGAVSGNVSNRLLPDAGGAALAGLSVTGMAAGGKKSPWNAWANVSGNDTRQHFRVGVNQVKNDVNVINLVAGLDYAIAPDMVVGVSGAYDRGDGSMQATAASAREASVSKGYSIAPYFGYQISKVLALDATVGFGAGKTNSAGGLETEGDRFFYAANLNYARWIKDLQLSGKVGYLHGEEDLSNSKLNGTIQNNTAARNKLDRWQVGVQAAYWLGNGLQPYAGINYLSDHRASSLGGNSPVGLGAWQWAIGLNFFSLAQGINGGISYSQEEGRGNQRSNALTANVGIRF